MKKIKNRVKIVKFKPEEYKNYTIQYMEVSGFFKIFLGKMFKDMEKPFFTYIEDFVVFSNSNESLKNIIDDYIKGNTLDKKPDFVNFKDEFSNKSNITVFIRTPQIYENLYYYSNAVDRKDIKENKEFILSFEKIGFQLVSENEMFKTLFLAMHNPDAVLTDRLEKIEKEVSEDMFREELELKTFKIILPESFLEKDTLFKEYYDGGENLKFEGRIHKGHMTDTWKTYYKSGRIKSSVNYVEGSIEGDVFFYYDDENNTKKAEAYFEDDNMKGIYYEFYENGTQKAKLFYKKGVVDEEAWFFYPNGKSKIEGNYKNGLKHGRWKYLDEKGNVIGKEKWKNNELVK